jgi:thioredoxin reductase (NADPH)
MKVEDVVIIGCGPAGAAAAIQLFRSGITPVVFEKDKIGGLLRNANLVENYPGFPGGIKGVDLVDLIKRQLEVVGVQVQPLEALSVDYEDGLFITKTESGVTKSRFAVIASGTKPKTLPDVVIADAARKFIFTEAYPLFGVSKKRIVIIGAGDAAFDYALNLSQKNEVIILNRSDKTKCLPLLKERCAAVGSIRYLENHPVKAVDTKKGGVEITAFDAILNKDALFHSDYLITAIGREPNIDFLETGLAKKIDFLKKDGRLFIIGDVINGIFRQTTISVGDGVRAAMEIYGYLFHN